MSSILLLIISIAIAIYSGHTTFTQLEYLERVNIKLSAHPMMYFFIILVFLCVWSSIYLSYYLQYNTPRKREKRKWIPWMYALICFLTLISVYLFFHVNHIASKIVSGLLSLCSLIILISNEAILAQYETGVKWWMGGIYATYLLFSAIIMFLMALDYYKFGVHDLYYVTHHKLNKCVG